MLIPGLGVNPALNWPRAHWFVGTTTLLLFLLTGQYMLRVVHASHLDTATRLIFRSRHLFLLLSALANLALTNSQPFHRAQRCASTAILLSPALLLAAFFLDPARALHSSHLFHFAMYALFFAAVLFAIVNRPRKASPESLPTRC
jgi:hypothetical protein